MLRSRTAAFLALVAGAALAGCRDKPAPPQLPPPKVTVTKPVTVPVRDYLEYNGHLETTATVEVRARVKGLLTEIHYIEGTEVAKGDPLYDIDQREYLTAEKKAVADLEKAKADVLNWQAQIKLAEAELERATIASKSGVGAKTDLDKAVAMLDVNKAQKASAESTRDSAEASLRTTRIQLGYTKIAAEISGRISQTRWTKGNLVGQTEPTLLTTIVRMDELYVFFDAPEPDLVAYQRAMMNSPQPDPTSRQIDVEVRIAGDEGYPHKGKIDFRENRVNKQTGTVQMRGRIPNPPGPTGARTLYPGLYAHVRVPTGDPIPRLAIPEDCIMTGQEGRYVYVVGTDNIVNKRVVTLGPSVWRAPAPVPGVVQASWTLVHENREAAADGQPLAKTRRPVQSMIAITAGLTAGDRVIVDGTQKARPSQAAAPEDWTLTPPK